MYCSANTKVYYLQLDEKIKSLYLGGFITFCSKMALSSLH